MKQKSVLLRNSVLFFILYSFSLSYSFFRFGMAYPNTDGIGLIWLFPCFYLAFLIASLYICVNGASPKSCLVCGITPLAFIICMWGLSVLLSIIRHEADKILSNAFYPLVLCILSVIIFAGYVREYRQARSNS